VRTYGLPLGQIDHAFKPNQYWHRHKRHLEPRGLSRTQWLQPAGLGPWHGGIGCQGVSTVRHGDKGYDWYCPIAKRTVSATVPTTDSATGRYAHSILTVPQKCEELTKLTLYNTPIQVQNATSNIQHATCSVTMRDATCGMR
jgi:hypothetical protein